MHLNPSLSKDGYRDTFYKVCHDQFVWFNCCQIDPCALWLSFNKYGSLRNKTQTKTAIKVFFLIWPGDLSVGKSFTKYYLYVSSDFFIFCHLNRTDDLVLLLNMTQIQTYGIILTKFHYLWQKKQCCSRAFSIIWPGDKFLIIL